MPDEKRESETEDASKAESLGKTTCDGRPIDLIVLSNKWHARFPNGTVESFDGHRRLVKIEIQENNYLKESFLSGNQVREACAITVSIDGYKAFEGFSRTAVQGLGQAEAFLSKVQGGSRGPYAPNEEYWRPEVRKRLEGLPVYWQSSPARVKYIFADDGHVVLEADGNPFPPAPYAIEEGEIDGSDDRTVKVDIFDPGIWWSRKTAKAKP